ncbi:MAG: FtsW/RodA/SpoVE family cell cycle protein [Bacteroidales bacterium]|jgi:cell division protein FtsW|nr:FtsW/RodA/SpoVE family cell cycle protein [Bacteroidales bacterium]
MEKLKQTTKKSWFKGDKVILLVTIFLSLVSIYAVYSSGYSAMRNHIFYILLGFVFMFFFYNLNYRILSMIAPFGLIVAVILLLITLIWGDGRSISIFGQSVQTLFLIGFLVLFYIAKILAIRLAHAEKLTRIDIIHLFAVVVVMCGLMAKSNASTAILLFISSLVLFFVGNMKVKYILVLLVMGIFAGGIYMTTGIGRGSTFKNRVHYYITQDNSAGYGTQMIRSKAAIARSGILPQGPGNGVIKRVLPESESDYVYATIFEEIGLVLGILIILAYLWLFYRAWLIARRSDGPFGLLIAIGVGFWFSVQALIHIGVNCELLPATGQTLPFISRGGAAMVFSGMAIGILLNIGKTAKLQEDPIGADNPE